MNLVERRGLWFSISLVLILPGILYMIWYMATMGTPLPLAIDYTGGTQWELRFAEPVAPTDVRQIFVAAGFPDTTAFLVEEDGRSVQLKLKSIDPDQKDALMADLTAKYVSKT